MADYAPVHLPHSDLAENTFTDGGRVWRVTSLIERAKDLPVFDLPLCAVYVAAEVFRDSRITSSHTLAQHVRRCLDADMSKPVILDAAGFVMDGWHRIARALAEGYATIPAVRFEVTPPPDFIREEKP